MAMHDPPHPGEFIIQIYLEPHHISGRELAANLGVTASTLNRVLKGTSNLSPEMALRLSKALGRSPESWLAMQYNYDLWHAKQRVDLGGVSKIRAYSSLTHPYGEPARSNGSGLNGVADPWGLCPLAGREAFSPPLSARRVAPSSNRP